MACWWVCEENHRQHGKTIKDSDKVRIWSLLHYFIITRNMLLKDDQFLSLCCVNKNSTREERVNMRFR